MLYEGDVIEAVCRELTSRGYTVTQSLKTTERGCDVIAKKRSGVPSLIKLEAKGETSSSQQSSRYGRSFNAGQVRSHVAMAVYAALKYVSEGTPEGVLMAAVALPDNGLHRKTVDAIGPALSRLGIGLFWVNSNGSVKIESGLPVR